MKFNPHTLLLNLAIAGAYLLLAKSGMLFADHHGSVTLWWPCGGFALAIILLNGLRCTPGIFLGAFATSVGFHDPSLVSLAIGFGNTTEIVFGWWLLTRRLPFDIAVNHLRDFLVLVLIASPLIAAIGAIIDMTALVLFGRIQPDKFLEMAVHWWMADLLGIVLIAPLILIWRQKPAHWLKPKILVEVILIFGTTFLAGQIVFLDWWSELTGHYFRGFVMFLFLAVAAIRLGRHGVLGIIIMTAIQALFGASHQVGYFSRDITQTINLANFWLYILVMSLIGMIISCFISEKNQTVAELRESENRFRTLANNASVLVWMSEINAHRTYYNELWLDFTGRALEHELGEGWIENVHSDDADICFNTYMAAVEKHQVFDMEYRLRRHDGQYRWVIDHGVPRYDNSGAFLGYIGSAFDITERKENEEQIKQLAFYDPLTRLPNRRLLMDRLQQAMAESHRNGDHGAVLFFDLDNFKTLNDTLGHDKGDLLLQQVAQRLESCVREVDTVARLGGDEFVVMLKNLNKDESIAVSDTEIMVEKILVALNKPYLLGTTEYRSTPSIGIALFAQNKVTIEELIKQADIAMYQAKKAGRNTSRFFDPTMQTAVEKHSVIENGLRDALSKNQFQLHYQMQVNEAGQISGAEVLLRWIHPERGVIMPADFISLAEDTGLIVPIGLWVLETACHQLKVWEAEPSKQHLQLSVNVSARQFKQVDFKDRVIEILQKTGVNASLLKLELTESLMLNKIEDTIEKMHALKKFGVQFSMDDFGTGYSSLYTLKKLPLDQLKIDQSFVRDIATDPDDAIIVQTIIAMTSSMGMAVIAEGVETELQREFLLKHDCLNFQGYFFGKPVTLGEFERLVTE
jgi:diguanylate cyclase (GGDEF)-like protein/PAS domain S-box-containing protein